MRKKPFWNRYDLLADIILACVLAFCIWIGISVTLAYAPGNCYDDPNQVCYTYIDHSNQK